MTECLRIGCIKRGYGWLPCKEVVNTSNEATTNSMLYRTDCQENQIHEHEQEPPRLTKIQRRGLKKSFPLVGFVKPNFRSPPPLHSPAIQINQDILLVVPPPTNHPCEHRTKYYCLNACEHTPVYRLCIVLLRA